MENTASRILNVTLATNLYRNEICRFCSNVDIVQLNYFSDANEFARMITCFFFRKIKLDRAAVVFLTK